MLTIALPWENGKNEKAEVPERRNSPLHIRINIRYE